MSPAYVAIMEVLNTLPDTFVINEPTLSPVIEPGKHGLQVYVSQVAPVELLGKKFRDHTWEIAVVSPITGMDAAGPPLLDALHEVLDAVEKSPTVRWTEAALAPFADKQWCYTIQVTMYAEVVQEEEQ